MVERFGPRDEVLAQYLRPAAVPSQPAEAAPASSVTPA